MMKATVLFLALVGLTAAQERFHAERPNYEDYHKGETAAEHAKHLEKQKIAAHDRFEHRVREGYPSPERDVKMFYMRNFQFQTVYDILSFSLACMMATTVFLWMRVPSVTERYKTALIISGLVTFIAAYHYIRIFNSWVEAYKYPSDSDMTHFLEHEVITSETRTGHEIELHGMHGFKPPYHIHHHAIPGQTGPPTITGTPFKPPYHI